MAGYQSRRNDYIDGDGPSEKDIEKAAEQESSKKLLKTAGKGAAMYFGGPAGGTAVDMAADTKAGDDLLNKGAEVLNKVPGIGKAAKKLDDSGVTDAADKALDMGALTQGNPEALAGDAAKEGAGAVARKGTEDLAKDAAMKNAGDAMKKGSVPDAENIPKANPENALDNKRGNSSDKAGGSSSSLSKKKDSADKDKNNDDDDKKDNEKGEVWKKVAMIKTIAMFIMPFIILFLIVAVVTSAAAVIFGNYSDAFGAGTVIGTSNGNIEYIASDKDAEKFYERLKDIKEEYEKKNQDIDVMSIASIYHLINEHNPKFSYSKMDKGTIREFAEAMYNQGVYDEEHFQAELKNGLLKKYIPKASQKEIEKYSEEIVEYVDTYYQIIGEEKPTICSSTAGCTYQIKGFYVHGQGDINKGFNLANLKVRLIDWKTGKPTNGELIDFEKYILGVTYQEIGAEAPAEAIKTQMIAARSYALATPIAKGGTRKIIQESGNTILEIEGTTADQVYCDPDKGCSTAKPPIAADASIRSIANEMKGKVLVDSQGYVIYAQYLDVDQNAWSNLARQGYNYKQILLQHYNSTRKYGAKDILSMTCNTSNKCSTAVTGDYANWNQHTGPWANINLGYSSETINSAGCTSTAIAMLIAKSGVPTNIQGEFNPGTFVQYATAHGGYSGATIARWDIATDVAPQFKYAGLVYVTGYSKQQKFNVLKDLVDKGYYIIAEVKGHTKGSQHWVAIDRIEGDKIIMMDPSTSATDMWAKYDWSKTTEFVYYKVG